VSDGCYGYAGRSGYAHVNRCYKHAIQDDWSTGTSRQLNTLCPLGWQESPDFLLGTALLSQALRVAMRQHVSDGHYEPTVRNGVNSRFDKASVTNGACGVDR